MILVLSPQTRHATGTTNIKPDNPYHFHPRHMSIFKKLFQKKDEDGETPEFKAFIEGSMEGLRLQTEAHQGTWRLGKSERWDFSQDTASWFSRFPTRLSARHHRLLVRSTVKRAPGCGPGRIRPSRILWREMQCASESMESGTAFDGSQRRVGPARRSTDRTWQHSRIGCVSPTAFIVDLRARYSCFLLLGRFN